MYIKIVSRSTVGAVVGKVEEIKEVKSFSHYHYKSDSDELMFTIEIDGEQTHYDENDSITIFVMNNEGKTIDKVEWDYSLVHPEILA